MLTQCPNCQTMYQISAAELGAAKGFVKCGECASQFNALDRIADEPQFDPRGSQQRAIEVEEEKPAPTFVLMEDQDAELIDSRPQNESPDQMVSLATAQDELNPASADQNITYAPEELEELDKTQELALLTDNGATPQNTVGEREEHAQILSRMPVGAAPASLSSETHETLFHDPELDEAHGAEKISPNAGTPLEPEIDLDDVPAILQEELLAMAQTKNNAAPWYWTLLAFSLSIGVILQLGWHYREPMLARFPGMQSSMEGMCSVLGCEVLQQQPVERHDPRFRRMRPVHPRQEKTIKDELDRWPLVRRPEFGNQFLASIRQKGLQRHHPVPIVSHIDVEQARDAGRCQADAHAHAAGRCMFQHPAGGTVKAGFEQRRPAPVGRFDGHRVFGEGKADHRPVGQHPFDRSDRFGALGIEDEIVADQAFQRLMRLFPAHRSVREQSKLGRINPRHMRPAFNHRAPLADRAIAIQQDIVRLSRRVLGHGVVLGTRCGALSARAALPEPAP